MDNKEIYFKDPFSDMPVKATVSEESENYLIVSKNNHVYLVHKKDVVENPTFISEQIKDIFHNHIHRMSTEDIVKEAIRMGLIQPHQVGEGYE